ncbi:MAG: MerR family transcriptional regulator [Eubacterium sp.]
MEIENRAVLSIGEFSRLSGMKRKNLIYYDEIGLFSPEVVKENGYRYYSYYQLDTISVIYAMKEIGTPLKEIKIYLDERSPQKLIQVFTEQKKKIDNDIHKLKRISSMMEERIKTTCNSYKINSDQIFFKYCNAEMIFTSPEIEADDDAMLDMLQDFYEYCSLYKMSYGYPVGDIITCENLHKKNWHYPNHYFAKLKDPLDLPNVVIKPEGFYVIGYIEGDYDTIDNLYERLYNYIETEGLVICGDGYRESILDEIAVKDPNRYLFQVSIQARHKD